MNLPKLVSGAKSVISRAKRRDMALAVFAIAGAAGLLAANNGNQACVAEQERILLQGPYHDVPDRAAFAAERLCKAHGGQPGPGFSQSVKVS